MATTVMPELAPAPGRHWSDAAIRSVRDVASDVRMIEIEPSAGVRPYETGSHLDIAVEIDGLPDLRSYSLVGEGPVDGAYRIAVKEIPDSRGGSVWVRTLEPGVAVQVSEPASNFELQFGREEYLLIAGGIGITPMVGMAHALERHGRPFRLLYAAHTREQMPFLDELSELLGDRLELFVSAEGDRIDLGAEIERLHPDGELYLCGPLRLRDAARHAWSERDRRPDRLQFETFASGGAFAPEEFLCRVRDAGREVTVKRTRTLLDALKDEGVDMMWDCLRGECGLCAAEVVEVEGELDHRDVFLSDDQKEEGKTIVTCVSRVVGGAITIDTGFRGDPETNQ
ncbi:MAG: PDR/VanB family oxidoreductase [Solirubrobacterales bacterium]